MKILKDTVEGVSFEQEVRRIELEGVKCFKDHELTQESENVWLCQRPKSSVYGFRLVFVPGIIFFGGDLGEQVWKPYRQDTLAWFLDALDSRSYFWEKASFREESFYLSDAMRLIDDAIKQYKSDGKEKGEDNSEEIAAWKLFRTNFSERLDGEYENTASEWYAAYREVMNDHEAPGCCDLSTQSLYQYEACKAFARLYKAQSDRTPDRTSDRTALSALSTIVEAKP